MENLLFSSFGLSPFVGYFENGVPVLHFETNDATRNAGDAIYSHSASPETDIFVTLT